MKRLFVAGLVACALPSSASADVYTGYHLVKEEGGYYIYATNGVNFMWACSCGSEYLGGAPSDLNISPQSNDAQQLTSNPLDFESCAMWDTNGDGLIDYNFTARWDSLVDLGAWDIVCQCYQVNPSYCQSDPGHVCGISCLESQVYPSEEPSEFQIEVYNSLPTASITHAPTPAWNTTLTFDGNAEDPDHADGSGLDYYWSITTKPSGAVSLSNANSASPSLAMNDDANIGHWVVKLDLDDQEGERITATHSFDVPNVPPEISIDGDSEMDALEDIQVTATPTTDPDGGNLSFSWDIVSSPSGSSHPPANNVGTAANFPTYTTDEDDIGNWQVRVTATDNEGPNADPPGEDTATFTFKVLNLPPRIDFVGETEIDVGDSIDVATSVLDDDDGGALTFVWDIIQSPDSAGIGPQSGFSEEASLYLPALTVGMAGTWIFRLTATDNEGENADPPGVTSEDITVLVDGQPTAVVVVSAGGATLAGDPPTLSVADFPLTLDASDSEDPDSPCVGVSGRCHSSSDPPVKDISPAITTYQWSLVDVPSDLYGIQPLGRVDEVLGINGSSSTLAFSSFASLGASGQFTFEVTVWDGEDNEATALQSVMIIDPNTPPTAVVSPPMAYMTLNGAVTQDVALSGVWSFDLDNTLLDQPLANGLGIQSYSWTFTPPAFCSAPAGPSLSAFNLFAAGAVVPLECQGVWDVQLTVGDDDNPQLLGSANTFVVIRNCPNPLCIDAPTTAQPAVVEFTDQTDVTILYHLDATIYNHPEFNAGAFTELAIFHEDDDQSPFYVDYDFNVLANDQGAYNVFNWNGAGTGNFRPLPGHYHVRVSLLDASLSTSPYSAIELNAISVAVADVSIADTSDILVRHQDLDDGTDTLDIDFSISGVTEIDEIDWYVYDAANTERASDILPGADSGTINWNGHDFGVLVEPGYYTIVVEAKRQGASLGVSAPHAFTVYSLAATPSGSPAPPQGMPVFANIDDDDWNDAADNTQTPAPAQENDIVQVDIVLEPFDLVGSVVLSASVATFRLYEDVNKSTEIALPRSYDLSTEIVPTQVFLEGVGAGAAELRLQLETNGVLATEVPLALNIVAVETVRDSNNDHAITAADTPAFFTRIGRWDNSYDAAFNVINNADPANFIEQDPSRFYIRVTDAGANTDPAAFETRFVQLGTLDQANATNDVAVQTLLMETGANTGVFVSRSQLLTTNDIPTADDDFAADDGFGSVIADDANNDRTHRVDINGAVRTSYMPAGAASAKVIDVPVCQRGAESRRRVEVRLHVFNEPFQDIGFDHDGNAGTANIGAGNAVFDFTDADADGVHDVGERSEPYIDLSHGGVTMRAGDAAGVVNGRTPVVSEAQANDQVTRADIAWAQACLRIVKVGATIVQDAPQVGGVDIIADGQMNNILAANGDVAAVFNAFSAGMTNDIVEVFFAAPMPGANAVAIPPFFQTVVHNEVSFTVLVPQLNIANRTLAHELGHLLLNGVDAANPQTVFYPALSTFTDDSVSRYRRITQATETTARTVRPLGNLPAAGNSLMKNP